MSNVLVQLPKDAEGGRRIALITDQTGDAFRNKTAIALLRFRPQYVVCVIDPKHVGADLGQLLGTGHGIPVVGTIEEAIRLGARQVVIGVATPGGFLPAELRPIVYEAIRNRLSIVSGLHASVDGDPNLASLAARHAIEITSLRKLPLDLDHNLGAGRARQIKAFRVLTVGTDANIGKTTVTCMLEEWFRHRHVKARMVATGQDGMLIKGRGLSIDRCITDFATGAVERLVAHEAKGYDLMLVEGQDALLSPCYSPVAMALLHGTCPDAMVMCHMPSRTVHRHTDVPIPPLKEYIAAYELLARPVHPAKVIAVALNTVGMDGPAARAALAKAERETGLPAADLVRDGAAGCDRIAEAVAAAAHAAGWKLLPKTRVRTVKAKRRGETR
jgi:uncharacterized NAD-dependent epimerase/dehydratase family protein